MQFWHTVTHFGTSLFLDVYFEQHTERGSIFTLSRPTLVNNWEASDVVGVFYGKSYPTHTTLCCTIGYILLSNYWSLRTVSWATHICGYISNKPHAFLLRNFWSVSWATQSAFTLCLLCQLGDAVVLVRQTAAVVVSLTRETAATAHYVKQMSSAISESNRSARNSKKSAQKMRSLQSEFVKKMSSAILF